MESLRQLYLIVIANATQMSATAIAGIELAHRIHKRQYSFGRGRHGPIVSLKQLWDRALT